MITKWLKKRRQEIIHTTAFAIDPEKEKLLLFVELSDDMVSRDEMADIQKYAEDLIMERTGLETTVLVVRNGRFKFAKVVK